MNTKNFCLIMAGGIGSRFWPLSTEEKPKQFIDILGVGKSLLRITFERMSKICPSENIYIVTNENYEKLVIEDIPEINNNQILKEPYRKNTAPCIAYGTSIIKQINENANIIVTPSDHLIIDDEAFISVIKTGLEISEKEDFLLTIGIKPTKPATGYGYIQTGKKYSTSTHEVNKIKTFTEKPNSELAKTFIELGDFFWNSGIFIWSAKTIENAFKDSLPDIYNSFKNYEDTRINLEEAFLQCQSISIDYGVMEKAQNVYMIQATFGWNDLGTWGALYENLEKDTKKNAIVGNVSIYNTHECVVSVPAHKTAVIDGIDNCIVVDSGESLLICKRDDEQKIRQFVNDLKHKTGESFL